MVLLHFFAIAASSAANLAVRNIFPVCFAQLTADVGFSNVDLGWLTSVQMMFFAVSLPLWGAAVDMFSAHHLLAFSTAVWSLATVSISFASSFWAHILFRGVIGAFVSSIYPLSQSLLCDLIPLQQRGRAFGVSDSLAGFVAAVGMYCAAAISPSWRTSHIVCGAVGLAAALLISVSFAADGRSGTVSHALSAAVEYRHNGNADAINCGSVTHAASLKGKACDASSQQSLHGSCTVVVDDASSTRTSLHSCTSTRQYEGSRGGITAARSTSHRTSVPSASHGPAPTPTSLPRSWQVGGDDSHSRSFLSAAVFSLARAAVVARRAAQDSTFTLLVGQGLFGAVAWNAHSFLWAYYAACGLTRHQIGILTVVGGVGAAIGPAVGGVVGDFVSDAVVRRRNSATSQRGGRPRWSDDEWEDRASLLPLPQTASREGSGEVVDAGRAHGSSGSHGIGSPPHGDASADTHCVTGDFSGVAGVEPAAPLPRAGGMKGTRDAASEYAARAFVALCSVAGGIPLYMLALSSAQRGDSGGGVDAALLAPGVGVVPDFGTAGEVSDRVGIPSLASFSHVCFYLFMFGCVATGAPAAAIRPIMGDIVHSSTERAQLVSTWVAIETAVGALLGAPVVGILSTLLGYRLGSSVDTRTHEPGLVVPGEGGGSSAAEAIGKALGGVTALSWVGCSVVWAGLIVMLVFRSRRR